MVLRTKGTDLFACCRGVYPRPCSCKIDQASKSARILCLKDFVLFGSFAVQPKTVFNAVGMNSGSPIRTQCPRRVRWLCIGAGRHTLPGFEHGKSILLSSQNHWLTQYWVFQTGIGPRWKGRQTIASGRESSKMTPMSDGVRDST